jgi:hypothetical protein
MCAAATLALQKKLNMRSSLLSMHPSGLQKDHVITSD